MSRKVELTAGDRALIVHDLISGKSTTEVARVMGCSQTHVSRIAREQGLRFEGSNQFDGHWAYKAEQLTDAVLSELLLSGLNAAKVAIAFGLTREMVRDRAHRIGLVNTGNNQNGRWVRKEDFVSEETQQLTNDEYAALVAPEPRQERVNGSDHPLTGDLAEIEQDLARAGDMIEQLQRERDEYSSAWQATEGKNDQLLARVTELEAQLRLDHQDALSWREHQHQLNAQKLQTSWARLKNLLGDARP